MRATAPTQTLTLDEFKGKDGKQGPRKSSAEWAAEPAAQAGCLDLR